MLAIELNSDSGIEELRFAIVKQACVDYNDALTYLRGKTPSVSKEYLHMVKLKKDCERFFRSELYRVLCDIDGEHLMEQIRKGYYNRPIRWGKES